MKTQKGRFKEFWVTIQGNDLFVNKSQNSTQENGDTKVMHSLIGTFIMTTSVETDQHRNKLWPVKISFPPGLKFRVIYFKTEKLQLDWFQKLKNIVGQHDILEFYDMESVLGKG